MRIEEPWKRLDSGQFWRAVDTEHNRIISNELGDYSKVLEIGCGYGSLVNDLENLGFNAIGIDLNEEFVQRGKAIFPNLHKNKLYVMNAEKMGFQSNSFDCIVLRDCMHHLYQEADIDTAFSEIERVLRPGGALIVFDPQPNAIVLISRWIINHKDAQCSAHEANELLCSRGWKIERQFFTEFFALPLSGGYVGVALVPPWKILHNLIIKFNRSFSIILNKFKVGRFLLWRYVIAARLKEMKNQETI